MITRTQTKFHGGVQGVYSHESQVCQCSMTFAVYLPPEAEIQPCPVLWYLSGLTCTHANVMDKGSYQRTASRLGLAIVCPDTSPRGENVPDDKDNWQFGSGAGFYLDATEEPWRQNYNMYSYVNEELPTLVAENFPVDMRRQAIFGHSMGGHGALVSALRQPERFKSCSAFAPIVSPSTAEWSKAAFARYLGQSPRDWRSWDACSLLAEGHRFSSFLVDQGTSDQFLDTGLRPWLFEEACKTAKVPLTLRMQEGYDHSYSFISTFMEDHITWHSDHLKT